MKLTDLLEYSMGIQGKNSNAKAQEIDEPEVDVPGEEIPDPKDKNNDVQKQLSLGSRKVGAMSGNKIQGTQFAAGATKVAKGKVPSKAELKQLAPIIGDVTNAMSNPKFANRLGALLKQAGKDGVDESTLAKRILKKLTGRKASKSTRKKSRLLRETNPRLLREADPKLFEINFNTKEIAAEALDLPIRCGFEAETCWDGHQSSSGTYVDDMGWDEVEEFLSRRDLEDVNEGFNEWIVSEKSEEFLVDIIDDWITENKEDEGFIDDFIDSGNGPSSEAIERYKKEFEDTDPTEYENRAEDGWEYINWCREYVEEEYEDEYHDFLRQIAGDEVGLRDQAIEEARDNYGIDDWISSEFYSTSSMLDDYGVDYSSIGSGDLSGVADDLRVWVMDKSKFRGDVEYGEYGSTHTDGWAVEDDSSIEGDGVGAEIISPVYESPREMLKEMKSLFEFLEKRDVDTNQTTGLHVTMSWSGDEDNTNRRSVKMAALLGDKYLMSTFGRENNSYTKAQSDGLKRQAKQVQQNPDDKDALFNLEQQFLKGISGDKFNSIHFKTIKDNQTNSELTEFRIGGNHDYHHAENFSKIIKAVVRYSTIMKAGYTDDYNTDYAKALFRLIANAGKIDAKTLNRAKDRYDVDNFQSPLVDLVKSLLSADSYLDGVGDIINAIRSITKYNTLTENLEDEVLLSAQTYYINAIGQLGADIGQGNARGKMSAKMIGVIRNSLKDFKLTPDLLSNKIIEKQVQFRIEATQNDRPDQRIDILKKGIDLLFKKEIIQTPDFMSHVESEKLVQRVWSAIHSDGWTTEQDKNLLDAMLTTKFGKDYNMEDTNIHNTVVSWRETKRKREYNDFYNAITRGTYNAGEPLFRTGHVYHKDGFKQVLKATAGIPVYKEPVSPKYNRNLNSDDTYLENYLNSYTMRLRKRFQHWREIKSSNLQLYLDSIQQMVEPTSKLISRVKGNEDEGGHTQNRDRLGFSAYVREDLERILEEMKTGETDPFGGNIVDRFGSRITDAIRDSLQYHYRAKEQDPDQFKDEESKKLIAERFDALKEWMRAFDKIAVGMGFDSQETEIADKQIINKREKQFKKNRQEQAKAKLVIPAHSFTYIDRAFVNELDPKKTDNADENFVSQIDQFKAGVNNGGSIYIVPAAHWSQADEAWNVYDLLDKIKDTPLGDSQMWRKEPASKILKTFRNEYGVAFKRLQSDSYMNLNDAKSLLQGHGVEFEQGLEAGDSREPHVQPLIPHDETQNPKSEEPFDRTNATMTAMNSSDQVAIEQKRFNAHDWSSWTTKVHANGKEQIAAMIKDGDSFHYAYRTVVTNLQNSGEPTLEKLMFAAGLVYDQEASAVEILRTTNWPTLADFLKIQPGVNEQGYTLLKKLTDTFMEDLPGGIYHYDRWSKAVLQADEHIKQKFEFDGSEYSQRTGDNGYQSPRSLGSARYEKAREEYPKFNMMMNDGMFRYVKRGVANDIVTFLTSEQSENLKQAMLDRLIQNKNDGGPVFDSFRELTKGSSEQNDENNNESKVNSNMSNILEKFESLSLNEKLAIIRNDKVSESLADMTAARIKKQELTQQDFKQEMITIWDNKPWPLPGSYSNAQLKDLGFKRFNGGWKVSRSNYDALANPVRKVRSESLQATDLLLRAKLLAENVPNNNKLHAINDILSKHFPVGDLDIQFKAFMAMPIPRMMTDFSRLASGAGYNACGRDIVKHYAKSRLSDEDQKKLNLSEGKEDLVAKIEALPDDAETQKLVNYIEQLIQDTGAGGRIQSLSKNLESIPDEDVKKAITQIAKIVASIEMSPEERATLFVNWKADKLVNVDALLSATPTTLDDIYIGYGSKGESHITELVDDLQEVVQYGIGPGEFALAVLSQRISGIGASSDASGGKGDLIINGSPVELKTTRKNAARFNDRQVTTSNDYKTLVTAFFTKYADKFKEIESKGIKLKVGSGMQQAHVAAFLKEVPEAHTEVANIISNIFTGLPDAGSNIATMLKSGDINGAMQLIAQANVNNYLAQKRSSGNLAGILFLDLKKQTFNFIKDVADLQGSGLRLHAKTNYLITTNENPFANTSIIPTSRNVAESIEEKCPRTKATSCSCESVNSLTESQETVKALCEFEHTTGEVKGLIYLKQEAGKPTVIHGNITGLTEGEHGFHIHEFGDLSKGCESAGGHYNPDNVSHGNLEEGHVGDLGNIVADSSGNAQFKLTAERVDLHGDRSVVGRAFVIHADVDDLGEGNDEESLKTGNAGDRLACGVIRLMNLDESTTTLVEDPAKAVGKVPTGGMYKRHQMPQLKLRHLSDPVWHQKVKDTFGVTIQTKRGNLPISKIKPGQVDRVPGLSDSAKKFFAKGQQVEPFIIDNNGILVNGHHRYDAAIMLGIKSIPFVLVDKTIHELVKMFGPGSEMNVASPGGKVELVRKDGKAVEPDLQKFADREPVDLTDPKMADLQRRLDKRLSRSNNAKQGWAKRQNKLAKDAGQQELPFPEKDPA